MQVKMTTIPGFLHAFLEGNTPYGISALEYEITILKATRKGERNNQLNKSAFSLFQLVAGGELNREKVESNLYNAAILIGLTETETNATIKSAFVAGRKKPRTSSSVRTLIPQEVDQRDESWQIYTLADAYKERPPVEYVVSGLFELPSLNIVYGAPATFKSFILADLAMCVAVGRAWLPTAPWKGGAKPIKTSQGAVLWLDFDNGARRTHDRFRVLGNHYKIPINAPVYYFSMPWPPLSAIDITSIESLIAKARYFETKLIIIDNLGTVSGKADENSAEMVKVMFNFRKLAEEAHTSVVLVHHQRKNTGRISRVGDRLRGHSSIEASLDLALLMERKGNSDLVTIKSTKTRGEDVYPFSATFSFDLNDNGRIEEAGFYGLPVENKSGDSAVDQIILSILKNDQMNKTKLTSAVKDKLPNIGINRIRNQIDRLEVDKKITSTQGSRTERIFRIAE